MGVNCTEENHKNTSVRTVGNLVFTVLNVTGTWLTNTGWGSMMATHLKTVSASVVLAVLHCALNHYYY